jgi:hypothetical protein
MHFTVPHPSGLPVLIWAYESPPRDIRKTHICIPFRSIFDDSEVSCESLSMCYKQSCPFFNTDHCRPLYVDFIKSLNLPQSHPELFV